MKKLPSQAALAEPYQRRRSVATARSIEPPAPQQGRSRAEAELILLVHAGWVGMALLIIACFPAWNADFNQRLQKAADAGASVLKRLPGGAMSPSPKPLLKRQWLFAGGSDSLVARTVGHAEGTRTPDGRKTNAYYGHTDPGNRAWNLGSFSFQHCREVRYNCSTPEQADDRQLQRLQLQNAALQQQAAAAKLSMTLAEELNGIDLANQAPLAALSDQGYVDRLSQAKQKGFSGQTAILDARVWSYWNPQKNRWDASGLGNTEASIRHDQERRLLAIARAMTIEPSAERPTSQRRLNRLKLQPAMVNPYTFSRQRSDYLWWEAGYWDAKLHHPQQVPSGYESAYDQGFASGLKP